MKKREMIKEIQKHELTLRYDMFVAEDVLGATDSVTVKRTRIWGAHIDLMNQLGVGRSIPAVTDLCEIQQEVNKLTFSETFLGKR
jgi:hypothetical protein